VEYLTIYHPYKLSLLIGSARRESNLGEVGTLNWDDVLNKYAKDGYRVINSGVIVFGEDAIFWAMLEKA
jgi:hypothetical protein